MPTTKSNRRKSLANGATDSDPRSTRSLNSNWVNYKGSWTVHVLLIVVGKLAFSVIPGISTELAWTLTTVSYNIGQFLMFHGVTGIPWNEDQGESDDKTLWQQVDNGAEYTPARKYLIAAPIVLFLLSCHYSHYDTAYFVINLLSLLVCLGPKLPAL
ncbi:ORMDL-domain-containing protein [Gonapodya prolifera JEL478]|uniref:ORMDL-domain-containing protein n=1 Tax=Gonapodya prolifera (strain JEL478) TaxID=1344416 RepID=A0A139ATM5_GONPJ|nr:ORMDL-domain-containing protein [Gonapodya prolifera JEL478]|eukprot:KXS20044.1 ORMDL-domain-containing protein [Gonapodya prolifera JEL478]